MIEYAKALYHGWCQGQKLHEIEQSHENFVELCSRILSRDIDEVRTELHKHPWFLTGR